MNKEQKYNIADRWNMEDQFQDAKEKKAKKTQTKEKDTMPPKPGR